MGRRLPADRRAGGGMSSGLAWLGWGLAFAALGAGMLADRELARRMELVARAAHELRGPLTAARLGLHLVARGRGAPADRLAAIDLELRRAGLALDDLHAARAGRRARDRFETVAVAEVLRDAVALWTPLARTRGRELSVDLGVNGATVRGGRLAAAPTARGGRVVLDLPVAGAAAPARPAAG